jgi:type VI protein secretion system component VasK
MARAVFSIPIEHSSDGIKQLDSMLKYYQNYKKYAIIPSFSMFITRYDAKGMNKKIKDAFLSSVFTAIIVPCSNELNNQQTRMINLSENSPENDFLKLKHLLQTYLAISDSNQAWSGITDKKIVVPILRDMAITSIFGGPNVTSGLDTIVTKAITEYVSELQKNKNAKYRIKTNNDLVVSVQHKLVAMFDVDAVYGMAINELLAVSKNLELIDIVGNDIPLNLHASMALSEVYTPAGWDGNVKKRFKEASRLREHIEDWAIGGNKIGFSGIFNDPEQLYNGLVKRYSEDVKTQWRNFLNAVNMERYASFQIGQERLLQVSGQQSDIGKLVNKFAVWSGSYIKSDSGIVNEPAFLLFNDEMAFLRNFASANLPQYQKQFEEVAKGLAKASEENSMLGVFTGREGDPLLGTHQFITNSVLLPLSKDQKNFLEHLLMEPYNRTIDILKPELAKDLTSKWKDVFDWFDGSFAHLYPFVDNDKEASFEAVIEFFNRGNGTFWKTYNDYFSPYINRSRSSYESRNASGQIPIKFSSAFLKCLNKADTISQVFFKDGKRKTWKVTFLPQVQQTTNTKKLKSATITLGKESIALLTEPGKSFKWPLEGDIQKVELDLTDNLDRNGKKILYGSWGFMRLMNTFSIQSNNILQSSFPIQMKTSHNARIEITLPASITVSSSDPGHPFGVNVLKGFSVPAPKAILASGGEL